jgi:DNA-binding MarR family transcriptional regulator
MKLTQKNVGLQLGQGDSVVGSDQEILRSLRRIFHAVDRHSRRLARMHGLTEPQALCLNAIQRMDLTTPGLLARVVSLSPPTVTGILDRLERRGLVRRERNERDKRQVVIRLTEAGRRLLFASPPPLQERFTRRLAALPVNRQRRIAKALEEVVKLLEAEDIDAAPLLARGAADPRQADDTMPLTDAGGPALDDSRHGH